MSRHVVILGAGISGLATAWYLRQKLGSKIRITILEKNNRVGGWIQTEHYHGFLFELGPHSCRIHSKGMETLSLIESLGLQNQVVVPPLPSSNSRYIYQTESLKRLPDQIWQIPFSPLTKGWLKALWQDLSQPKRQADDESIYQFFSRRLGVAWTEQIIDPFVQGIYAGDIRHLSMKSCFAMLDAWEQQEGSLLKGAWRQKSANYLPTAFTSSLKGAKQFSFIGGMSTLPLALAHALSDCILLGKAAVKLDIQSQSIEVKIDDGCVLQADAVISTIAAPILGDLLTDKVLSKKLKKLAYASVIVVNIGYKKDVLSYNGFGYLIPSKENKPILGCIWDSSIFPQQNEGMEMTRLTIILGGSHYSKIKQLTTTELEEYAVGALASHLGIKALPDSVKVTRIENAIPQFELGFALWQKEIDKTLLTYTKRLILTGSAWSGVSINDCITRAKEVADKLTLRIRDEV